MNISSTQKDSPLILVVDDDKFMRLQLRRAMEQAGYQVVEAADGEEGLAAYAKLHPDIVLLDALMPVMDGFTCCHRLHMQTDSHSTSTPVLMITSLDDQESVDRAFAAGAVDYITKPIHWAVLRQRVRRLIEARQATEKLKQQTEQTRLSEERLRFALDAAHMSAWDWNLPSLPDNGCDRYEPFLASVHPEDRPMVKQALIRAIEQETDYDMEFRVIEPEGTIRWTEKKGRVLKDKTGKAVRLAGVDMDITERKRTEQQIREQAALLDITTDAIIVQNLESQILFWNKGAENLYSWKAEEVLGKNLENLLYKQISSHLQVAQKALDKQDEWKGELYQITKEGREVIVESRWTLVRGVDNKPKSILIVNTDITEKKKLETQFLRAQRMESLGTLAGGIAHDLNNVLAPILMAVQLLEVKLHDAQSKQLLSIVEMNIKRGADLVKQVLSFARGIEGERTTLQVGHLILEIRKIAVETFPKSINIRTDIQTMELWTVSGDATQLHQVLMNLCVNARDAMPDGGTLNMAAENIVIDEEYVQKNPYAKIGEYIVITVSDTGTGIPPEILDRIFEPFFTTKDVGKGTGLGLSTAIGIIKSHGGFVNVSSQVGKGTEFKVYLPATKTNEPAPAKDTPWELLTGNEELILVVDDEAAICEVTKTSLESYGYRVITARDGIEAIALYAHHKEEISVVLIDIMMPAMDGITTIRTIQKIKPQAKIIAASGFISVDKVADVARSGVKRFLAKPYSTEQLLKTLHIIINDK
jgi:PAS domain S-box-containing protein